MTTEAVPTDWKYQPTWQRGRESSKAQPSRKYEEDFADRLGVAYGLVVHSTSADSGALHWVPLHEVSHTRVDASSLTLGFVVSAHDSIARFRPSVARDESVNLYFRLGELAQLRSNWNGRGGAAPSAVAVISALEVVGALEESPAKTLNRVIPDANGGIGFVFLQPPTSSKGAARKRYASIDCSNSGRTMLVLADRDNKKHVVSTLIADREGISAALEEIDAFLTS